MSEPAGTSPMEGRYKAHTHPSLLESDSSYDSEDSTDANGARREVDRSNLPGGNRSLAGISIRSFLLGQAAGFCLLLTLILAYHSHPLWRAPFFITCLAVFHFLEFYITAAYSTSFATVSAFLLSSNGAAYNIAHSSAMAECLLSHLLFPGGYLEWTSMLFGGVRVQVFVGLMMVLVGQIIRSFAMVQAGSNFTHTVQTQRRDEHVLVKSGLYSILRHPSYFGFFWWGLGTQLVLGNFVCFIGYALVLWKFFSSRIYREEKLLIGFFGNEYIEYKSKSWVGIPFIG
ncbi:Protein-S-isoprenylcysteine O-methyltransferase [Trichophyton interdigitale]|uniref:Protein-S-isoprenylcysteine O-methyltransferase n=1 Tax=Trichophyton interdigitale TaxID=101480 RepID=A0A9P5D061_9EURO|nr:Protein-S-isoprenylcysteine O-methyltransferase [Trichophyton interdigitale]KAF3901210.1 Protein-S-isoprenylcysteine O-methyltransferase [Trichophyton interdigitale]KAG8212096.1 Protein-S-isoprenylcysteine O-methyltransferase [Trichophyton interdigitale]